jgi:hypothetical protein
MADQLAIVNRVIEEHHKVRTHLRLVGDSMNDLEGLISLEQVKPDWMLASADLISDKHGRLLQVANSLAEGLKNHFALEERHLPQILGELLMQALMLEHSDIRKALDSLHATLNAFKVAGFTDEELLTSRWNIHQKIDDLRQSIEGHAGREEVMLRMAKRALEHRSGQPGS